jgi:hypothetical protein
MADEQEQPKPQPQQPQPTQPKPVYEPLQKPADIPFRRGDSPPERKGQEKARSQLKGRRQQSKLLSLIGVPRG